MKYMHDAYGIYGSIADDWNFQEDIVLQSLAKQ